MTTLAQVEARLRRANRSRAVLLAGCCFVSVLLITAFSLMMFSQTVREVLPEGGDSRRQMMMIFVLTMLGCAVFTNYAAGIYFRQRSRETGLFLALGARRVQLRQTLRRELAAISLGACAAGGLLGLPLAAGIWQFFRCFVVDSAEMALHFDLSAYRYPVLFALFVTLMLFGLGDRAIRRTNIIDIIQESHKSEPIRAVPRWYGRVGLVLIVIGGLGGYLLPVFCVCVLRWYPPGLLEALAYVPALIGLYMVLLHTVANGWGGRRRRYRDIISLSMMKFQARQTVRNMLVMTLLIAGAYFASFYTPMLGTGAMMGYEALPVDYQFHYRSDQLPPDEAAIRALADDYGVTLTSYAEAPMARLAVDGYESVEHTGALGTTYDRVYQPQLQSALFFSESGYRALTGETVDVEPGIAAPIYNNDGFDNYRLSEDLSLITNAVTGASWSVRLGEALSNNSLLGHYVLDDGDYAAMTAGLTSEWLEQMVCFNVADVDGSYAFADALFDAIIAGSDEAVAVSDGWDPVARARAIAEEGSYWQDGNGLDYAQRDSSDFRLYWQYMPTFRILEQTDFIKTMAVYLMIFIFIALICFAAVFVIAYTRCLTIAMTNRRVYDDLRHLGAPPAYLRRSATSQLRRVFLVPAALGTSVIYAFFTMILFFNDGKLTTGELAGLGVCALLAAAVSGLLWALYRFTRRKTFALLGLG